MHRASEYAGALFEVASQFNMLEMTGPEVIPEQGVIRYQHDHTQGPACAIAAGAATIYRNYFAPVADGFRQTTQRQVDGLAVLGEALSEALDKPVNFLLQMSNGYGTSEPYLRRPQLCLHSITSTPISVGNERLGIRPEACKSAANSERSARARPCSCADILVNATSVGLIPDIDARLVRDAQACGCRVLDGLGMLVNQGVIGIKYWTGVDVDPKVMRARLEQLFAA